ncbi:2-polyprenylphenol 6-hydroxylase [Gammaproteobacteria bacterium]|nr:2-polyprenylphenol 6-hydroxylase [Gammaproteobacteria bacterium]MDA7786351.1 2-polyprenylphenol 6-hydroxylase [Gammaproteobacteria bacterium]MDA7856306.1 2-polyprenylphenol 6-hydroxylase [Gammaproteobacteria bacterium]MDA8856466.1 2-polyprenylphenol 6-hydroxylase [Gammaproteobacteria bacterium]MDA9010669.1 2-polyprenylphenol 6-hydroxylase [Gammaproteobacteria bacterium]|tara:strand:- start:10453 stop:11937 length:1485 start_codon:yes stop_codon:yes gene_type:complete
MINFFVVIYELTRMGILGVRNNIFFAPNGIKAVNYLQSLGPIFIKFGQLLSTRTDILDEKTAKDLQVLTDQCRPFETSKLRKIVEDELGNSIENVFDNFNEQPLAAASLAQVHEATLKDGKSVVIKVLRPNIERDVRRNLKVLKAVARIIDFTYKESNRLKPLEVVKNYETTILRELDLRLEASNTSLTRKNFLGSDELYIPEIYWELTTSKIMVVEKIDGIPCTDIKQIEDHGINKKLLAENGVMIFLNQVFRDNFFHADMHPGNIFVARNNPDNPGYIAIDCAISGSLSNEERYILARMLQAVLKQNYKSLSQLFISSGWVDASSNQIDLENTLRACCEPIFEKPLSEIEFGKLLLYLFQSTRSFGLSLQPSLVLLQKTLIHIEGMGRQIYPKLDFWGIAEPYLDNWLKDQLNPLKLKDFILNNKEDILHKASELPSIVYETLDELRGLAKHKSANEIKIRKMEIQIQKEKFMIRACVIVIIFIIALAMYSK